MHNCTAVHGSLSFISNTGALAANTRKIKLVGEPANLGIQESLKSFKFLVFFGYGERILKETQLFGRGKMKAVSTNRM